MSATGSPLPRGFTLIEALVVVGIAALISGLAFARVETALAAQQFRTTTACVALALQQARAGAIRSGAPVIFRVVANGHGYASAGQPGVMLPEAALLRPAQRAFISFYPDGTSSGGSLRLLDTAMAVTLSIQPSTGQVIIAADQ
ncbi:MAG: GspH/FimT family pseudopilin [Sphingomonas sp.]